MNGNVLDQAVQICTINSPISWWYRGVLRCYKRAATAAAFHTRTPHPEAVLGGTAVRALLLEERPMPYATGSGSYEPSEFEIRLGIHFLKLAKTSWAPSN
jgi:hypothetical protein